MPNVEIWACSLRRTIASNPDLGGPALEALAAELDRNHDLDPIKDRLLAAALAELREEAKAEP